MPIKKKKNTLSKIWVVLALLITLISSSISGFIFLEGWNFFDAFYMTVITLTTVGFGEVRPLTEQGRLFTSFILVFGLSVFTYAASIITAYIFEGEFKMFFKEKQLDKRISQLKNHYIVCGFGRIGSQASIELSKAKVPFVVIEQKEESFEKALHNNFFAIKGSATEDETLLEAGILTAKGIIAALPEDADNVFVTLTARNLNPKLQIVARASHETSQKKLLQAGANSVILPNILGAKKMAHTLLRPGIADFIDTLVACSTEQALVIEELKVFPSSPVTNRMLKESAIRRTTGALVIGIKNPENQFIHFNHLLKQF
ncbi:potassium channel protein [bacterium]|nr:potassium channel protein [bacterium]